MRLFLIASLIVSLGACSGNPPAVQFEPSKKSAVELRSMQVKLVPGNQDTVMRGVVGTLHDLGYRITKVEVGAGTVSATRQTALRMAIVVRPKDADACVVRANATVISALREGQVDTPEFYQRDFFEPLGSTMQRQLATVPDDVTTPDPVRPVAELNSDKERKAAAKADLGNAVQSKTGTSVQ